MRIGSANKIEDINAHSGGRAYYANAELLKDKYLKVFKPLRTPYYNVTNFFQPLKIDRIPEVILNTYKFKGIEFGNWVDQTRRLDFCFNLFVGLYDLNKVLKFDNNIGIYKTITLAYGARGAARALAHYEPPTQVINLSRDRRVDKVYTDMFGEKLVSYNSDPVKYKRFAEDSRQSHSGYGSFAHEYGHALDYIIASKYCDRNKALSGGSVVIKTYKNANVAFAHYEQSLELAYDSSNIEDAFYDAFTPILFSKSGIPTGFYKRMYDFATKKKNTYWIQQNEIWARVFETYIAYKLHKQGIKNKFLTADGKGKYKDELGTNAKYVYPTFNELIKVEKQMDHFFKIVSLKLK